MIRLSDEDRAALKEAGDALLSLADELHRIELGYLAGRLHGLAGRVPAEFDSPN